jgi:hypothetical protein
MLFGKFAQLNIWHSRFLNPFFIDLNGKENLK